MRIHIDYNSGEPIYRQAVEQIKLLVVSGKLSAGDRIPSIRELARDLKINPTTAAKIYTELEHAGVLTLRQGQGAFVTSGTNPIEARAAKKRVAEQAQRLIVEALRLGLTRDTVQKVIDEEFNRISGGKP